MLYKIYKTPNSVVNRFIIIDKRENTGKDLLSQQKNKNEVKKNQDDTCKLSSSSFSEKKY